MAISSAVLLTLALLFGGDWKTFLRFDTKQVVLGISIAAVLWFVFWIGGKLSGLLFDFSRSQVQSIYGLKSGVDKWILALQLLCLTGPAEEIFWRGYLQRKISGAFGQNSALIITLLLYTLIHVWSLNFMLIMAALVAGAIWGGLYRLRPSILPALVISHALWDAAVFVVFPLTL